MVDAVLFEQYTFFNILLTVKLKNNCYGEKSTYLQLDYR